MYKLGRNEQGQNIYITDEQVADAAKNPSVYKDKLSSQQWAKLRKIIRRAIKNNSLQ
jgi:hypothetical protein